MLSLRSYLTPDMVIWRSTFFCIQMPIQLDQTGTIPFGNYAYGSVTLEMDILNGCLYSLGLSPSRDWVSFIPPRLRGRVWNSISSILQRRKVVFDWKVEFVPYNICGCLFVSFKCYTYMCMWFLGVFYMSLLLII